MLENTGGPQKWGSIGWRRQFTFLLFRQRRRRPAPRGGRPPLSGPNRRPAFGRRSGEEGYRRIPPRHVRGGTRWTALHTAGVLLRYVHGGTSFLARRCADGGAFGTARAGSERSAAVYVRRGIPPARRCAGGCAFGAACVGSGHSTAACARRNNIPPGPQVCRRARIRCRVCGQRAVVLAPERRRLPPECRSHSPQVPQALGGNGPAGYFSRPPQVASHRPSRRENSRVRKSAASSAPSR